MYKGSSIELNALGESWRCRKCKKKKATACLGYDRGFLVATEMQEKPKRGYYMFGS